MVPVDFAAKMPMVRARKQTAIPSVWSQEELKKLIGAIDHGSPKGKRDYAIILIACRLGLNPETANQNQLVITTHESRLLNLRRLRKDEIYFVTNRNGESIFVRLDDFEAGESRSDLNIETSYLNGRYGGIPILIRCEGAND